MINPIPDSIKSRLNNSSEEARDLLADVLTEHILSSSIPEESKIEVRIMKAYREFSDVFDKAFKGFAEPIAPTPEGKAFVQEIYPARKEFLEYLQLMKAGLDSFLAANPVPEIPPEVRSANERYERG